MWLFFRILITKSKSHSPPLLAPSSLATAGALPKMWPPAATAAPLFLSFSAALLPLPLPPHRLSCSPVQSTLLPHRSPPPPTGAGSGTAAPNPTDVFLLLHYSAKAAAADAKRKHTKNKKPPPPAVSPVVSCCYGCGAPLQTDEADAPGYVDTDTYQLVGASFRWKRWLLWLDLVLFLVWLLGFCRRSGIGSSERSYVGGASSWPMVIW